MQLTIIDIALLVVVALVIVTPPKFDPAVRLKEFNERWAKRLADRDNA